MNDLFLYSHSKFAIYEDYGYLLKALWVVWESIRERNYRLKKRIIYLGLMKTKFDATLLCNISAPIVDKVTMHEKLRQLAECGNDKTIY